MLKKIKGKIISKKTLLYFLSFIIPVIILVGYVLYNQFLTDRDFFMNGENFLTADMGGQYNALYNYIRNVFLGKDSIFYSFHNSLGGNMSSTIGYYLASPFNFLYIFVSKSNIPLMTYIIYVLKISLCSLFMNIYLGHKFGHKFTNLIFCLSYAFMGFVIVYFFNNMWLDVIYMTPLVILGIDKLIDGKPLMYIITLCLSIIFNFYIAYMLCIFCVIYFIYELFIRYSIKDFKKYKQIILRFIVSSLLAAGLAAFFLIPVLLNLSESMRTTVDKSMFNLPFDSKNLMDHFLYTVFSKVLLGSNTRASMLGRNRPVIYISLFCLILAYLYFFNKKIKRKEKLLSLGVIFIFLLSFMIPHLQYIWQGMSFPNGYIDRYSFLYCFFLILLAAKCFYNKSHIKVIWFILFIILFALCCKFIYQYRIPFLDNFKYNLNIISIFIYLICCFIYFNLSEQKSKDIILIIFLLVLTELTFNYSKTIIVLKKSSYGDHYRSACKRVNNIENNFYRVDGDYFVTLLDSFACDYYNSTTAISTSNSDLYNFYYKFGGNVTIIGLYDDYDNLPIINSLMGIKYIASWNDMKDSPYKLHNKILHYENPKNGKKTYVYIYKNDEALSIGYVIDKDFENNLKLSKDSTYESLNSLLKSMSGKDLDVFEKIDKQVVEENTLYRYYIDKNTKYLYLNNNYEMSLNFSPRYDIYVDEKHIFTATDGYASGYRIKNKYYYNDIMLRIANLSLYKINNSELYYFDEEKYKEHIEFLKRNQLEDIVVNGNIVSGNINLDKDGLLFMSIPYDKGWKIYVDGKKVKYKKLMDAFIGINLSKGKHEIKMKFYPKGLFLGWTLSLSSLILIIIYNFYLKSYNGNTSNLQKKVKKNKKNKLIVEKK